MISYVKFIKHSSKYLNEIFSNLPLPVTDWNVRSIILMNNLENLPTVSYFKTFLDNISGNILMYDTVA